MENTINQNSICPAVAENTIRFIQTLRALSGTEENYLNALQSLWGEDVGNDKFAEANEAFAAVRRMIADEMARAIMLFNVPQEHNIL